LQQSKRTVAEVPYSLSVWDQEDPVLRTGFSALGLTAIAMWQPILVQSSREIWGLPHTPSCFTALLKYSLPKINYAIAASTTPSLCHYSPFKHQRPESETPLQLDCGRKSDVIKSMNLHTTQNIFYLPSSVTYLD
jgi:hypothetical protein